MNEPKDPNEHEPPRGVRRGAAPEERDYIRVCGVAAADMSARARFDDVVRVLLTQERSREFGELLAACARARLPYRLVEEDELAKVAGTRHHQGICVVMRPPRLWRHDDVVAQAERQRGAVWLFLDRIGNPHNLGAIARTAAHFGVTGLLTPDLPDAAGYSTAAFRTAEGGFEALPLARLRDPLRTLRALRELDHQLLATAADGEVDLWQGAPTERVVWLLGTEREGLADPVRRLAHHTVAIGGTGAVESLNVSTAAALCLGASWRASLNHPDPR